MGRISLVIVSLVFIFVSFLYIHIRNFDKHTADEGIHIIIKTIAVENGFGYEIKQGSNIIIKQHYIPAVKGKKYFCTENDARTIAEIIKNKIENKESPSISYQELVESNISLHCTQNAKNDIVP